MFHAAMSEGSMGLPRLGPSVSALPSANVASPQDSNRLRIYMAHLSLRIYGPAHDRIEVVIGKNQARMEPTAARHAPQQIVRAWAAHFRPHPRLCFAEPRCLRSSAMPSGTA